MWNAGVQLKLFSISEWVIRNSRRVPVDRGCATLSPPRGTLTRCQPAYVPYLTAFFFRSEVARVNTDMNKHRATHSCIWNGECGAVGALSCTVKLVRPRPTEFVVTVARAVTEMQPAGTPTRPGFDTFAGVHRRWRFAQQGNDLYRNFGRSMKIDFSISK